MNIYDIAKKSRRVPGYRFPGYQQQAEYQRPHIPKGTGSLKGEQLYPQRHRPGPGLQFHESDRHHCG